MNEDKVRELLQNVAKGAVSVESATSALKTIPFEDIEIAHVDHLRSLRKGFPEVIYGESKTSSQIIKIMEKMVDQENTILVTRLSGDKAEEVLKNFPDTVYHEDARLLVYQNGEIKRRGRGYITVLAAGTSDLPVALEAYHTADYMGNETKKIIDVGVAGIHRLFNYREVIEKSTVIIVVAGMEGALPSVVAGMVSCPVIAVPTSVGYGTSFGGLTALFGMLNSCSSNIAVVNIDNGFGAGFMAASINRK